MFAFDVKVRATSGAGIQFFAYLNSWKFDFKIFLYSLIFIKSAFPQNILELVLEAGMHETPFEPFLASKH